MLRASTHTGTSSWNICATALLRKPVAQFDICEVPHWHVAELHFVILDAAKQPVVKAQFWPATDQSTFYSLTSLAQPT